MEGEIAIQVFERLQAAVFGGSRQWEAQQNASARMCLMVAVVRGFMIVVVHQLGWCAAEGCVPFSARRMASVKDRKSYRNRQFRRQAGALTGPLRRRQKSTCCSSWTGVGSRLTFFN